MCPGGVQMVGGEPCRGGVRLSDGLVLSHLCFGSVPVSGCVGGATGVLVAVSRWCLYNVAVVSRPCLSVSVVFWRCSDGVWVVAAYVFVVSR